MPHGVFQVGGEYSFKGIVPGYYFIRFTYGDGTVNYTDLNGNPVSATLETKIDNEKGTLVSPNDFKSTIISDDIRDFVEESIPKNEAIFHKSELDSSDNRNLGQWYKNFTENYSIATDDLEERKSISNKEYNYEKPADPNIPYTQKRNITIHAFTPRTYITIEDDEDDDKNSTQVDIIAQNPNYTNGELGITTHYYNFEDFNFGIIGVPETKIQVDKKIVNIDYITTQGMQIVSGNPQINSSKYLSDLDGIDNNNGSRYARLELSAQLLDNSKLALIYEVSIENKSDIFFTDDEYLLFGTGGKTPATITVKNINDYLDEKFDSNITKISNIVTKFNPENREQKLKSDGQVTITESTELQENPDGSKKEVKINQLEGWKDLETGESEIITYKVFDTVQTAIAEPLYLNKVRIQTMQASELNTINLNTDIISISPWDSSLVEQNTTCMLLASTGGDKSNTIYIAITISLLVMFTGIVIIKKKVLN